MPLPGKRRKLELLGLIEDYRQGLLPLIVPLTLLKHRLNRYPVPERVSMPFSVLACPRYPERYPARRGSLAGVPESLSQGIDVAESR